MKDVINLVRIIINGFSDTCTEVELFDLIFFIEDPAKLR